ncbi:hypothetical protein G7084_02930 [Weissella coleopterorum]|uniref:DUF4829 domain-containing protein n=1 Tax=Weissella coleopterorum TaxID=2714949 RepID=A0A6G8AZR0_9LACO|nr:hypothetical protein [Weissella coleopterorum]QIL50363.1 hypothetical protein G7084_02930 [Weissella coleopterorum]
MKKIIIFISTSIILMGIVWGIVLLVQVGGGFKNNDVAQIRDTGQVRAWTKSDFQVLTPQDWDDNSDSQYKKIIKVFGPGDFRRKSEDHVGAKKDKVVHLVITWRQKKENVYLGFYKYSDKGQWILHDKTWTDK